MEIENLTIKQAREIAALFFSQGPAQAKEKDHPFVGKYCIFRCYSAGVHAGYLVSMDGTHAIVKNSRRLWQWSAKSGIALSGVAQNGYKGTKVDSLNPLIALTEVIEVIPCANGVEESINAVAA